MKLLRCYLTFNVKYYLTFSFRIFKNSKTLITPLITRFIRSYSISLDPRQKSEIMNLLTNSFHSNFPSYTTFALLLLQQIEQTHNHSTI